ncbi:hypothetical protein ACNTMW_29315 [Planosporangium sp. 12N6]|uniref:hypothetical protein n=1 Tax=Planosporangium spinosum TaxID=3402278 RepID=UPI003CEA5B41
MRARLLFTGLAAATASALVGCSGPDVPQPNMGLSSRSASPLPFPESSVAPWPTPPVSHKWKTDGLRCPELTNPAARALGISGAGTVTNSSNLKTGNIIDCRWGPGDDTATRATLHVMTTKSQEAADAAWQTPSIILPTPLNGVGELAFISNPPGLHEIQVAVRSGNARLTITLTPKKGDAEGEDALRDAASAIATDMLTALVPA